MPFGWPYQHPDNFSHSCKLATIFAKEIPDDESHWYSLWELVNNCVFVTSDKKLSSSQLKVSYIDYRYDERWLIPDYSLIKFESKEMQYISLVIEVKRWYRDREPTREDDFREHYEQIEDQAKVCHQRAMQLGLKKDIVGILALGEYWTYVIINKENSSLSSQQKALLTTENMDLIKERWKSRRSKNIYKLGTNESLQKMIELSEIIEE